MKVSVLGYGTVGTGVYEMLRRAYALEPGSVLVRPGKAAEPFHVTDIDAVLSDDSVGAVVEAMGGTEPAFSYACGVLRAGKHFVTSNKALVAAHGIELAALARENRAAFLFSAACGGGVPLLHNLALAARSDDILSVSGILNGTTNYMLHAMQTKGMDYAEALKIAQELGYAEADPTADVSGLDAARKITLACAVAFSKLPVSGIDCEGIDHLSAEDVKDFQSRGLTCRLLARGKPVGNTVSAYVEPVLLRAGAPECAVLENYNMASYLGQCSGSIVLMGQGAGRYPTASAVVRDLTCIQHGKKYMLEPGCAHTDADNSQVKHAYYVRLPAELAGELPAESAELDGDVVRMITKPISVSQMHFTAARVRSAEASIFFAAIGG
jgi:homoserine dehydrogenase